MQICFADLIGCVLWPLSNRFYASKRGPLIFHFQSSIFHFPPSSLLHNNIHAILQRMYLTIFHAGCFHFPDVLLNNRSCGFTVRFDHLHNGRPYNHSVCVCADALCLLRLRDAKADSCRCAGIFPYDPDHRLKVCCDLRPDAGNPEGGYRIDKARSLPGNLSDALFGGRRDQRDDIPSAYALMLSACSGSEMPKPTAAGVLVFSRMTRIID